MVWTLNVIPLSFGHRYYGLVPVARDINRDPDQFGTVNVLLSHQATLGC